jgi:hypothetical protein
LLLEPGSLRPAPETTPPGAGAWRKKRRSPGWDGPVIPGGFWGVKMCETHGKNGKSLRKIGKNLGKMRKIRKKIGKIRKSLKNLDELGEECPEMEAKHHEKLKFTNKNCMLLHEWLSH